MRKNDEQFIPSLIIGGDNQKIHPSLSKDTLGKLDKLASDLSLTRQDAIEVSCQLLIELKKRHEANKVSKLNLLRNYFNLLSKEKSSENGKG